MIENFNHPLNRMIMNYATSIPVPVAIKIAPHPDLAPFISHYTYHNAFIPDDQIFEKKLIFQPGCAIDFFIGDTFKKTKRNAKKLVMNTRTIIRAPHAFKNCAPGFTGHFISFTINFHPTGLHHLMGIAMDELGNNSIPASDIKLLPFEKITEKMLYATDIHRCVEIVEPYLRRLAEIHQPTNSFTDQAAMQIVRDKGVVCINRLAADNYLSVSQLERNFLKKVGVCPKVYASMQRIFYLLNDKTQKPDSKWGALAYEYDYYDPIHFTREFKKYFSFNPSGFVPSDYILM